MKKYWIEKEFTYDGAQLRSHWIFENTGILGDAVVAFIGAADVPLNNMVDLVDVAAKENIYSKSMLHFIIEHFGMDLEKSIFCQRIFSSIVAEELTKIVCGCEIERKGDDIFDKDRKLSVSIATLSPVSSLIHFGINIISEGTPVPTKGLSDYKVDPRNFADVVMTKYISELESASLARCKVRPVR